MDFAFYRNFITVVETGSISTAAQKLDIVQPALSAQIKTLEKLGIFPYAIENAGKAKLLLDRLSKRREEGLTTPKQIRFWNPAVFCM